MLVSVFELTGLHLDWAVSVAAGVKTYGPEDFREQRKNNVKHGEYVYRWSSSWSQGGPLLEDYNINLSSHTLPEKGWMATPDHAMSGIYAEGPTPLIAAMRSLVANKLGEMIEIPEALN